MSTTVIRGFRTELQARRAGTRNGDDAPKTLTNTIALLVAVLTVMVSAAWSAVSAQQAFQTGKELIAACRVLASGATAATDDSLHVGICLGEIEALNWLAPGVHNSRLRSCVPENITMAQMANVIVHYLDRDPDRLREPFEGLALEALAHTWPCQKRGWLGKWLDW